MFLTINNTAKELGITASSIRRLVHEGRCPGYNSGTRFYVNVERLNEQLSGYPQTKQGANS